MTNAEKLKILAEAMDVEVDELHEDDNLTTRIEWDSLAVLSFMANVSSKTGKRLKPQEMQEIITVRDALELIP